MQRSEMMGLRFWGLAISVAGEMTMRRVLISVVATLGILPGSAAVGHARTVRVGINFRHSDYVALVSGADVGAVVRHDGWNNSKGGAGREVGDASELVGETIKDSTGAATSLTIAWSYDGTYADWGARDSEDEDLMAGYLDILTLDDDNTVAIGNIPAGSTYDVYAYFGANADNRTGTIGIDGAATYSYNTHSADKDFPTDYLQTTDTGTGYPDANYAVWTGLSGTSFTLRQNKLVAGGSGNLGLHGIQIIITSRNLSFEVEGTDPGHPDWRMLPAGGAWVDGNDGNDFEILGLDAEGTHFPAYGPPSGPLPPPDGNNVLNLSAASPLSQNLYTDVRVGDVVTIDFFVGNSADEADPPADVTAGVTIEGAEVYSEVVVNDAPDGKFVHKSVQWTATRAGDLGIEFSGAEGAWIDDVGFEVTTAPTVRGDVDVTNWDSVFFSDGTYDPTASGSGSVSNSLPQDDDGSYSGGASGSQTYGDSVSWAEGSAVSDVGAPVDVGFGFIYPDTAADASLELDLGGASAGSSAVGLTHGGISGTTFDGSDPGGDDGFVAFTVDFTIDALAAGSDVDGSFGVQVDVFNWTLGDLIPVGGTPPHVTGPSIAGSVDMTEEARTDALGDAWTFALTAAEIAAAGGSVDGTYAAHFTFTEPNDPPTSNSAFVTITAFARGEAGIRGPGKPGTLIMVR